MIWGGKREKEVIYLTPWWSWRLAWLVARPRRSWSPPFVSWMCDVSWADYGYPGNVPGRWSTCALYSPSTRARRMSRIRCTIPRRMANTLKIRKDEELGCQAGTKRGRVTCYGHLKLSIIQAKIEELILKLSHARIFRRRRSRYAFKRWQFYSCRFVYFIYIIIKLWKSSLKNSA